MDIYKGSKVFITGHTGLKGSWLLMMLSKLGANVVGYSDDVYLHYDALHADGSLPSNYVSIFGNILDKNSLTYAIYKHNPDIIFHLAAQPLVSEGYKHPFNTFEVNVVGTLNVLDICRNYSCALVCITTDKVYANKEWSCGYRENDILWGSDPYSASKVCAEQIIESYRKSYGLLVASARAGNVIGGGECRECRLLTDIMNAYRDNSVLLLRNPDAKRPFQHVLDCNYGYLLLGKELLKGNKEFADSWNFCNDQGVSVGDLVKEVNKHIPIEYETKKSELKETVVLSLDGTKSNEKLGHRPLLSVEDSVEKTCLWFKEYYDNNKVITVEQVENYYEILRTNKK